jgi:hypothetical protein
MASYQHMTPFGRYVRLYTLHRVETVPELVILRVRIETLRYSFSPLTVLPLDAAYAEDPREGAALVRQTVLPRLQTLLDLDDPWEALRLSGAREALWQRYAAERGLSAAPVPVPAIQTPGPAPRLPARSPTTVRLDKVQRALATFKTAVDTAGALAALWQNWQIGRGQRQLLAAQRTLLQDAIQTQLEGQGQALDRALDRGYVRGYLAEHGADPAYEALFDPPDD